MIQNKYIVYHTLGLSRLVSRRGTHGMKRKSAPEGVSFREIPEGGHLPVQRLYKDCVAPPAPHRQPDRLANREKAHAPFLYTIFPDTAV